MTYEYRNKTLTATMDCGIKFDCRFYKEEQVRFIQDLVGSAQQEARDSVRHEIRREIVDHLVERMNHMIDGIKCLRG